MAQEISFEDMDIQSGPRIEKFRYKEGEQQVKKRIYFNPKVFKETVSFKDNYGYFKFVPKDGQKDLLAEYGQAAGIKTFIRYGQHVLSYHCDSNGALKTPFSYSIEALIKTEKSYAKIYGLWKQYGKELFMHDFYVSFEGQLKFQNMNFTPDLNKAAWMLQPNKNEILADIQEKVAAFDLSPIIAPTISYETLDALLSGKLPNRFATKNQAPQTGETTTTPATVSGTFSQPNEPATVSIGATKSDLDLLEELSRK